MKEESQASAENSYSEVECLVLQLDRLQSSDYCKPATSGDNSTKSTQSEASWKSDAYYYDLDSTFVSDAPTNCMSDCSDIDWALMESDAEIRCMDWFFRRRRSEGIKRDNKVKSRHCSLRQEEAANHCLRNEVVRQEEVDWICRLKLGKDYETHRVIVRSHQLVAKCNRTAEMSEDADLRLRELAKFLSTVPNHPNVQQFAGTIEAQDGQGTAVLLEWVQGYTLKELWSSRRDGAGRQTCNKLALRWSVALVKGLDFLHSQEHPFLHLDLCPDNVIITEDMQSVKIKGLRPPSLQAQRDQRYSAPELQSEEVVSCKADVFSCALIIWEMFSCKQAFSDVLYEITNESHRLFIRPPVDRLRCTKLIPILEAAWAHDPAVRIDARVLLRKLKSLRLRPEGALRV